MRYRYNHGKRFSRPTFGLRHGQFPHKNNRRKSTNDLIKELRKFLGMINLSLGPNAACSVLGSAAIELMDFGHTYSKAIFAAIERNDTSGLPIEMHSDGWTESNFVKKMSGLLHLEEAYQAIETRRTDVRSVRFEIYLRLINKHNAISGTSCTYRSQPIPDNKMLRLNHGDTIYIKPVMSSDPEGAECHIGTYNAEQNRVIYHPRPIRKPIYRRKKLVFITLPAAPMDIRLRFNLFAMPSRVTFRYEHNALLYHSNQVKRLHPEERNIEPAKSFELDIDSTRFNESQQKAIKGILTGECKPAPFILFGPPGTGKTHTLLEAVRQIYFRGPLERILICTGSNDCADELYRKLLAMESIDPKKVIRLNAKNRRDKVNAIIDDEPEDATESDQRESEKKEDETELEGDPAKILGDGECEKDISEILGCETETATGEDRAQFDKDLTEAWLEGIDECTDSLSGDIDETLDIKRIIVSTCVNAGSIQGIKFDYAFLDEAGQVHEADSLIVATRLLSTGLLVLCGDPYQLGPVVSCKMAEGLGLGSTLLERLFGLYNYKNRDERFIAQLNTSYRCDPRILSVSNELFYDNSLICANETPEGLMKAMNVSYPLLIHSTEACDSIKPNETSSFNEEQAKICARYFRQLIAFGYVSSRIGIISPFKKQVGYLMKYIQEVTRELRVEFPQISTVERFQGNERDIIIISTVKSYFPGMKEKQFIFQEKRFNVSVSRARHMVIVVGDRRFLEKDTRCWRRYLDKAEEVGPRNTSSLSKQARKYPPSRKIVKRDKTSIFSRLSKVHRPRRNWDGMPNAHTRYRQSREERRYYPQH